MLGLRITLACYRWFGRWVAVPLVHAVVTYFYATDRKGRAASLDYLARLRDHCERTGGPAVRANLWESYQHYRAFAVSILDRVALWSGMDGRFTFAFPNQQKLEAEGEAGRGVLLLGAHLGSFDALRALALKDAVPVNAVMYTAHASRINRIFRELSPDVDIRILPVSEDPVETVLRIHACLRRGEWVAILADRLEPGESGRTRGVSFLGSEARVPRAPFDLAATVRAPVYTIFALRDGPARYRVVAEPLSPPEGASREARADAMAATYAQRLEESCITHRHQWFNFYDFWDRGADA